MTASLHTLGAGRKAGNYYVDDPNREARPNLRDEYYAQDGGGVWWSTGSTLVRHGAPIDKESFRDLCAGVHPVTGEPLVRGIETQHRAGWDVTFTAPKSLSILWMAGNESQRTMLHQFHSAAVHDALRLLVAEGLVEVRRGQAGYIREAPSDVIVGLFDHYTSREGDGNVHTHAVVANVAYSKNKYFTLEPEKLFKAQLLVGAAYRASLAQRLTQNGFKICPAGRNQLEIDGIAESQIEVFSKRSQQIEGHVSRDATAAQKELAALRTRGSKDEVPVGDALEKRWRNELAATGIDPWQAACNASPSRGVEQRIELDLDPPEIEGTGPVAVAASALFRHQNVLHRKDLLLNALVRASLAGVGIAEVYRELETYEQQGVLRKLTGTERAECWTTPSIAASEASLLRAVDRPNERDWFRSEALDAALANAPHLSDEQAQAVRFSANRDGVSICEAPAGTGKTVLARALVDAALRSGMTTVLGLSPTWVAADELSKSCGIEALSIARWRHDHLAGKGPEITAQSLIIVDEVSVASVKDMAYVAWIAQAAQSKCICLGDRRQLSAVSGGSALRAMADVVARAAVLSQIRRQQVDWQRAASIVMAKGDSEAGLRAYAKHERLELISGEAAAQDRVIQIWSEYRRAHGDVLIITRRNADAATLNKMARGALRADSRLIGPDISVTTVNREGKVAQIELAQGDRIRFCENLPQHRIRNGNRGTVERIEPDGGSLKLTIRLEDGRLVEEQWASLVRPQRGRSVHLPRVSLAYAGTAYSVQGRTSAAAVLYISKNTDAREAYVGLTRHRLDARVIAERDRLEAAVRQRQIDRRIIPSNTAIRERLFAEARSYAEKANVVDYVRDRIAFIRSGEIEISQNASSLNLGRVAQAVRRLLEAIWDEAEDRSLSVPFWRLVERMRHMQRQISERVTEVIRSVTTRIELRGKERAVVREWDISR